MMTNSITAALRQSPRASILLGSALALGASALIVRSHTQTAERKYPALGKFVTGKGARLHYVERGVGQPVVFLHGNGVMIEDMLISGIFDDAARSHRAIAFDRPGFGHSDRPRGKLWTAGEQAAALMDAFKILGIDKPIVVGHSYGAVVALALALDYPAEIGGLVLASGYYFPTARLDAVAFSAPAIPLIGDLLNHTIAPIAGEVMSPRMVKKMFAPQAVPKSFQDEFPFGLMVRPSQIHAASQDGVTMVPSAFAMSDHYAEIRCQVAIVAGDQDTIVDPATQAVKLRDAIPGSSLEMVRGAGHMVHHADRTSIRRAIDAVTAKSATAPVKSI